MCADDRVWDESGLADPHGAPDKAHRVRRMFAAIAPSYDLNNRLHSLGCDQGWRRAAVKIAQLKDTDFVLDVACGTGDLSMAFGRSGARQVLGIDFTVEMLDIARQKARRLERTVPYYGCGDAMVLPLADASVDVVSIAFGIRNVIDPAAAIREFARVLRMGGRLVILEFDMPTNRVLRRLYNFYFSKVLPRTAGWIARDRSGAYQYLPTSVNTFVDRQSMMKLMTDAGLTSATARPLTFGIAVVYRAVKER